MTGLLTKLEEQIQEPVAQDDPVSWAKQAINRVREFVGNPDEPELSEWRKTKLMRALSIATQKVVEEWNFEVRKEILSLMEHPGARIAVGEGLVDRLVKWSARMAEGQAEKIRLQIAKTTLRIASWTPTFKNSPRTSAGSVFSTCENREKD